MPAKFLVLMILLLSFVERPYLAAQELAAVKGAELDRPSPSRLASARGVDADAEPAPAALQLEEIIDRVIAREHEQIKTIERYAPIIETYIQEVKPDKQLGIVPKTNIYFLGQADFRGRLKVTSSIKHGKRSSLWWSYNPAGFLQMIYVDRGEFDKAHYKFTYRRQEFSGEVRCYVFDVAPAAKAHGARFAGRIWVEDQDFTIVHFNGNYTPAVRFSFRSFEDEYYLHFDSWHQRQIGLVASELCLQPAARPTDELQRPALQVADAPVGLRPESGRARRGVNSAPRGIAGRGQR